MNKKMLLMLLIIIMFAVTSIVSLAFKKFNDTRKENSKNQITETLKCEEKPILLLTTEEITIYQGDEINYLTFIKKARDCYDGNLLNEVVYDKVNTSKIGTHTITYSVLDKANNKSTAELKVIVKEVVNFEGR